MERDIVSYSHLKLDLFLFYDNPIFIAASTECNDEPAKKFRRVCETSNIDYDDTFQDLSANDAEEIIRSIIPKFNTNKVIKTYGKRYGRFTRI